MRGKNIEKTENFRKVIRRLRGVAQLFWKTSYRKLAVLYLATIFAGFACLSMPFAKGKSNTSFSQNGFDYLFTSVSAFTTTGLTTSSISCTFNLFGQIIILILIQIGGWGVLAIWSVLKSSFMKSTIGDRIQLHSERGGTSEGTSFEIVKSALSTLFLFELWIASILTFFFYLVPPTGGLSSKGAKGDFWTSLWWGIFHSVSAINNSGLDIISSSSITPYSKGWGSLLSVIFAFASITGGIGYPVLFELKERLLSKRKGIIPKNFSLFTKISLWMYLIVTVIAILAIISSELISGNFSSIKSSCCDCTNWAEKAWQLIYLVISSRSSGFSGLDLSSLHEKSQWILLILMFIGASPASTAGGIRSITLFLIVGKIWSTMRGKRNFSVWSRTISEQTIESSYIVFFVSIILITLTSLFIKGENSSGKHSALFEASSAFGTSGLTLGVTEKARWWEKTLLMILMFVGQMGIPNTLLIPFKGASGPNIQYPEEKIRIS